MSESTAFQNRFLLGTDSQDIFYTEISILMHWIISGKYPGWPLCFYCSTLTGASFPTSPMHHWSKRPTSPIPCPSPQHAAFFSLAFVHFWHFSDIRVILAFGCLLWLVWKKGCYAYAALSHGGILQICKLNWTCTQSPVFAHSEGSHRFSCIANNFSSAVKLVGSSQPRKEKTRLEWVLTRKRGCSPAETVKTFP